LVVENEKIVSTGALALGWLYFFPINGNCPLVSKKEKEKKKKKNHFPKPTPS